MARTKLFVSYSHHDRSWLEQLKIHLALLIRRGLVHVWSDTRIGIGSRWKEEIETALSESDAAVLLVTPDFLASDFIWNEELPKLVAHQKQGMQILPLIVRPCAWRIAPELAALQSRPADGRPLALGNDAEIDLALTEFAYELADRLKQLPAPIASEERDLLRATHTGVRSAAQSGSGALRSRRIALGSVAPIEQGQTWEGTYHATERQLRLVILKRAGRQLVGKMEYDDGSVTDVEGEWCELYEQPVLTGTVTLREIRIVKEGHRPPHILGGEYIALIRESVMTGVWQLDGSARGYFELRLKA
jgi:hypothetical protein